MRAILSQWNRIRQILTQLVNWKINQFKALSVIWGNSEVTDTMEVARKARRTRRHANSSLYLMKYQSERAHMHIDCFMRRCI